MLSLRWDGLTELWQAGMLVAYRCPRSLRDFRLTKCSLAQAGQAIASYVSSETVAPSSIQCWTATLVLGHKKMDEDISLPSVAAGPAKSVERLGDNCLPCAQGVAWYVARISRDLRTNSRVRTMISASDADGRYTMLCSAKRRREHNGLSATDAYRKGAVGDDLSLSFSR